jgi:hypothetical protein
VGKLRGQGGSVPARPIPLAQANRGPVFGIIKQARGFRQFLLRGVRKVTGEWSLLCTCHNLLVNAM